MTSTVLNHNAENAGLAKLAAFMCFAVAFGGALAELALAWVWLSPEYVEAFVVPHIGLGSANVALDGATRLAGFAVSMIPLGVLFFVLHQAYELFNSYRLGNVFTAQCPIRLRRIGLSMIALGVLRPITSALLSIVLTAGNPAGQKMLVIGVSIDDYMIAIFGGLIVAIGHAMVEANRLADENSQIV